MPELSFIRTEKTVSQTLSDLRKMFKRIEKAYELVKKVKGAK